MTDKVLIIDGLNFIYKGNIKFNTFNEIDSKCSCYHFGDEWRGSIENTCPIHGPEKYKESISIKEKYDYTIVYNFFRNLRALVEMHNPNKIFFCLEGQSVFRYKLYSGYKANRIIKLASKSKEESDNFNRQRDIIFSLVKYLPITTAQADNYEADDVIFSLVDDLRNEECVVVSNDSDLKQLLQKGYKDIKIYDPFKKVFVETPKAFVLVVKALAGDASDNIPGLVGKKKAESLALNPEKLSKFLENSEHRIQFNDNIELIKLRLIPKEELNLINYEENWILLKNEFENMKFDSLIRSDVWHKFRTTFVGITL